LNRFEETCTDSSGTDSAGNTCSFYSTDPRNDCGSYDVRGSFVAATACCICGGGTTTGNVQGRNDDHQVTTY